MLQGARTHPLQSPLTMVALSADNLTLLGFVEIETSLAASFKMVYTLYNIDILCIVHYMMLAAKSDTRFSPGLPLPFLQLYIVVQKCHFHFLIHCRALQN